MTCDQIMAKVCRGVISRFLWLESWNFAWWLYIYVSPALYLKKSSYQLPGLFSWGGLTVNWKGPSLIGLIMEDQPYLKRCPTGLNLCESVPTEKGVNKHYCVILDLLTNHCFVHLFICVSPLMLWLKRQSRVCGWWTRNTCTLSNPHPNFCWLWIIYKDNNNLQELYLR